MEKLYVGLEMANKWSDPPMVIMGCAFLGIPGLIYTSYLAACYLGMMFFLAPTVAFFGWYQFVWMGSDPVATSAVSNGEHKYLTFHEPSLAKKYTANRIPISHLYEYYIDGALEFKGDVLDILDSHRDEFVNYRFTMDVFRFLIVQFLGPMSSSFKGMAETEKEIAAHYGAPPAQPHLPIDARRAVWVLCTRPARLSLTALSPTVVPRRC
jgi:hypothetical protein